ncbi:MAG TPA: glycine cleavage T C-terminal barrel domain-containing protein [Chthoniobacterales bacterium]
MFFDCSARVKLRVRGADSFRFLNGQLTNDLRKATAASTIQGSILSAKGKLNAHVFISIESESSFLLDADRELTDQVSARLERYIIADDVEIDNVTDLFSIYHFLGEPPPAAAAVSGRVVASNRYGLSGWDLWCNSAPPEVIRKQFSDRYIYCDDTCAEVFRIERGIPRWGRELTNDIIPVEANLEATSVDYGKGCYIGQEVISRMKMSGQTNKRLCGLISASELPLEPETRLTSETDRMRDAGWITSATRSARVGGEIALGYVKRGFNETGTRLLAGGKPVKVVPLPFV